jgi:L-alanine-DL-glutamate epimerase-like enolase superfamily enzyme
VKITRITSYAIEVPIRKELMITSSLGTHDVSRPVLVRLETDAGVEGAAEATVTPAWSGETAWGTKALIDHYLAPAVLGLDVRDTEGALTAMDRAVWGNPFAKAAIEMAMLDAWGRAEGKPVHQLFGGPVRDAKIPIRFSLAAVGPGATAENARKRVAWGHRTIKVKVGRNAREDVERVRAVREAIGPEVALTVDANGGWSEEDAEWALKEMASCNLLLAEQPTAREDLGAMARLREKVEVPLMVDEGVFTRWEAEQALKMRACDIVAVYPGKNGGFTRSLRIVQRAAEFGAPCAVGSNLELDPGTAAMCHLTLAAANIDAGRFHGDILGPLYHEVAVVKNPLRMESGFAWCPDGPGFGVDVDWDQVERLKI